MVRNYVISYPRSGVNWTLNRIRALAKLAGDELWPKHVKPCIKHNHLGFEPRAEMSGRAYDIPLQEGSQIFVLLRDARKALVSNWYFILANNSVRSHHYKECPEAMTDLNSFLLSPFAAKRYCNYLKKVKEIKEEGTIGGFLFYEDIQDPSFMYDVPRIMGREYQVTEELAQQAQEASSERVVDFGTDHSAAKPETLQLIQEELIELCPLDEYRERYLD